MQFWFDRQSTFCQPNGKVKKIYKLEFLKSDEVSSFSVRPMKNSDNDLVFSRKSESLAALGDGGQESLFEVGEGIVFRQANHIEAEI